ncbi:MAG: LCP family protein [Blautia sp.]|nr:LCP family protein [Blautia sp.]
MPKRRILFILEMILLFLFLGILFVYGQISTRIENMAVYEEAEAEETETVVVNESAPRMTGFMTLALFGLDHRSKNEELSGENSDTIIIASVNNDTKDVKLVSVYRDCLLNIGDEMYAKINAAYAYGGASRAVNALNLNLDLNITDYVSVDFQVVTDLVDAVGGIEVPLSYAEMVHLNNYCVETAEETGKSYIPLELPDPKPQDEEESLGYFKLNGVQATSYCRIRYTASMDMGRTERQRRVIQLVTQKLKKANLNTILNLLDDVLPMIHTSLTKTKIISMIPSVMGYSLDDTSGFPTKYTFSDARGDIIVCDDLVDNVKTLHDFLYGTDGGFTPSATVGLISRQILAIANGEPLENESKDENNQGGDVFTWTQTPDGDTYVWTPASDDVIWVQPYADSNVQTSPSAYSDDSAYTYNQPSAERGDTDNYSYQYGFTGEPDQDTGFMDGSISQEQGQTVYQEPSHDQSTYQEGTPDVRPQYNQQPYVEPEPDIGNWETQGAEEPYTNNAGYSEPDIGTLTPDNTEDVGNQGDGQDAGAFQEIIQDDVIEVIQEAEAAYGEQIFWDYDYA